MDIGITSEYILDKMQLYEIPPLLERASHKHRESWEQTRMLMYVIAQGNSTKRLTPTDLLKFPWDEEESEEKPKAPTNSDEEIGGLMDKMQEFIKQRNNASGFSNQDTTEERPIRPEYQEEQGTNQVV